jgi:hypothetical protein
MRLRFLTLLIPSVLLCADNPVKTFQSCAYLATAEFSLLTPKSNSVLPWDVPIRKDSNFDVSVKPTADGYFYVFQDPADPNFLVFPALSGPNRENRVARGATFRKTFKLDRSLTTLLLFTTSPIPDFDRLTADEVRKLYRSKANCGDMVLAEKTIQVK